MDDRNVPSRAVRAFIEVLWCGGWIAAVTAGIFAISTLGDPQISVITRMLGAAVSMLTLSALSMAAWGISASLKRRRR